MPPSTDTSSYGDGFNAIGGGVYALLWEETTLQVWHFPRGSVPPDVDSQSPAPSGWGPPQALFGTVSCDVEEHFADMSIVLDLVSHKVIGFREHLLPRANVGGNGGCAQSLETDVL